MILIPRASKKSAEPDFEETALFPCFAIFWPQLAAIRAESDDMLKLPFPSPPVPTISASPFFSIGSSLFFFRILFAQPINSLTAGPFEAIATKIAAIARSSIEPSVTLSIKKAA